MLEFQITRDQWDQVLIAQKKELEIQQQFEENERKRKKELEKRRQAAEKARWRDWQSCNGNSPFMPNSSEVIADLSTSKKKMEKKLKSKKIYSPQKIKNESNNEDGKNIDSAYIKEKGVIWQSTKFH